MFRLLVVCMTYGVTSIEGHFFNVTPVLAFMYLDLYEAQIHHRDIIVRQDIKLISLAN